MTAGIYPQWLLDLVAPAQVYPSDADIMRRAIELTLAALQRGQGGPFGAIIATEQGEIVAVAHNEVQQGLDVTAHAEIVVIRRAAQALKRLALDAAHGTHLRLFTTCEPCAMCVGAIFWARLPTVIAATRKEDAQSAGMRQEFALSTAAFFAQEQMTYRPDFLRQEALEIFRVFGRLREARA
jgi:tRNA(Arg) A34 adenosine deaminase TadA